MKKLFMVIVVLILLILGGYFLFTQKTQAPSSTETRPERRSHPFIPTDPTTATRINELKAGGSSYRDPNGRYSFLYPNDYALDTQDPIHIRIYKTGATQQGQTEMYDGSIIVFESVNLGGQTLEQWVDNRIKESTADGTLEIIKAKENVTINGFPGFTYEARGLGTATYLVLQKDSASPNALVVTSSVSDPQNKNYQSEVDSILSTIELL